jgi:hypothetical protein
VENLAIGFILERIAVGKPDHRARVQQDGDGLARVAHA